MQWLLCDYGEVLSLAPPAADRDRLQSLAGWTQERHAEFWATYWDHRPAYDRADLDAAAYWARIAHQPPDPETLLALTEQDTAMWLHPNPESLEAVSALPHKAVFSNAPVEVAEGIDSQPWLRTFTRRFYSCRLRSIKPEPTAYHAVLRQLDARTEDVLFVDDRPANVDAARQLGIRSFLFEGPATLKAAASELQPHPR